MEFLAHLGSQRVSQQDLQNLTQGEASSTEATGGREKTTKRRSGNAYFVDMIHRDSMECFLLIDIERAEDSLASRFNWLNILFVARIMQPQELKLRLSV